MRSKKIIIALVAVLLLIALIPGYTALLNYRNLREYNRKSIIIEPDTSSIAVYIEPDDTATRAAANYLSFVIEQTLGTNTEIITEQGEDFRGIRILCGTEFPEPEQKEAIIEFITTAEASSDNKADIYSVSLEDCGIAILVPERENCFGAVKAIADRWLRRDCGISDNAELYISRAMIDEQLSGLPTAVNGKIRILSQNLRNSDDGDGKMIEDRAKRFFQLVDKYQPDLIGTQECPKRWLQLLQETLSDRYEIYGCSRMGPQSEEGDWNAVLFRKDRFSFQDGGTFWLSNTPSEAETKLNYVGPVRICTWSLLQDSETEKTFLFSNTHLHHVGADQDVRTRQAEILLHRLRKDNKLERYPGFLTGDFNGKPDEPFYSLVTEVYDDTRTTAITDSSTVNYTFQSYGKKQVLCDYCFCSPKTVTVLDYHILDDYYDGYISDHYGVLVTAVVN